MCASPTSFSRTRFVIPMSTEMTITQWHVPVDDENCYWYAIFTSYAAPVDKKKMREQRLELYELPDYTSRKNKTNDYGFDPHEQATATYTGMGNDINVHDQWAVELMGADPGPHQRASRHLGQGDRAVSPPAAAGDREGRGRRKAVHVPRRGACAQRSRARRRWTASGRPAAGKSTGWKSTSNAAAARPGPRRCRARSPARSGICRRRSDGISSLRAKRSMIARSLHARRKVSDLLRRVAPRHRPE